MMTCTICHQAIKSGDPIVVKGPHSPKGSYGLHSACLTKITGIITDPALVAEYNAGAAMPTAAQLKAKGMPSVGAKLVSQAGKKAVSAHLGKLAPKSILDLPAEHKTTAAAAKAAAFGAAMGLPAATSKPVVSGWKQAMKPAGPKTQKAKGVKTLQDANMLSGAYAKVALSEAEAIAHAKVIGLPCFCRPCPITPRHGFVDSRVVKTEDDVRQVWTEARAQDPQAELILMPFIQASHNMVWRPGLLSVGPGHDGATAGHDSVSIFLQPEYAGSWHTLATKAGCDLDVSDPFIEAVASGAHETVLTQIRAGVKGAPTASDWIPEAMTVGNVVTIDGKAKAEPEAMLKWETTAKGLKPGHDIVYNPGGNLGDHWSVHAQLAKVAVVTSFQPVVGQHLDKVGDELIPLEPQAIVFGYLGGLLHPDLMLPLMRKRAVCAALLGSHHGMRMGGDSGVFIGASVAMMLRLAQAALWGESRHAKSIQGMSRDQIYKSILNDWLKGRNGLRDKIALFWTHTWGSGFGGAKWAACAKATVDLDTAMLDLIRVGTRKQAEKVLAVLTNVVNLAHNNGWWLNKFCTSDWFDLAADLDPRVAIMAGPAWYDAATADPAARMDLLAKIEAMKPIDLSDLESGHFKANIAKATVKGKKAKATAAPITGETPDSVQMSDSHFAANSKVGKVGTFQIHYGQTIPVSGEVVQATMKGSHLQLAVPSVGKGAYVAGEVLDIPAEVSEAIKSQENVETLSGSGTIYKGLQVVPQTTEKAWAIMAGGLGPIAIAQQS